jgi:hypothetical protein
MLVIAKFQPFLKILFRTVTGFYAILERFTGGVIPKKISTGGLTSR